MFGVQPRSACLSAAGALQGPWVSALGGLDSSDSPAVSLSEDAASGVPGWGRFYGWESCEL